MHIHLYSFNMCNMCNMFNMFNMCITSIIKIIICYIQFIENSGGLRPYSETLSSHYFEETTDVRAFYGKIVDQLYHATQVTFVNQ